MNFDEQVGGLNRGSPVLFKGIQVGQVLDVNLKFDSAKRAFHIPVLIAMEPERFNPSGPIPKG